MLARAGVHTTVLEAQPTVGGGLRSAQLTLPGFVHDVCSAVHPLAVTSPAFRSMPLRQHGLDWIYSPAPLTHPLDDGSAAVLHRSVETTAHGLGADGPAWRRACGWLARNWNDLTEDILAPLLHIPRHPFLLARLGALSARSASAAARAHFQTEQARALFAGNAAHSFLPLESLVSGAFGWIWRYQVTVPGGRLPGVGRKGLLTRSFPTLASLEAAYRRTRKCGLLEN